jgi:hypothetical protein
MSFSNKDLEKYCDEIILKRAALDRQIVVLCEGFNDNLKELLKDPVPTIGENFADLYQDAAFYQRSIPKWCQDANIVFYICGKQAQVIKAYFYLRKKYKEKNDTRLDANKLFAWIDIDTQKHPLPEKEIYPFKNLESIYTDLYINGKVNDKTAQNHKIWVTGLLHKEAYFIIPELQDLFNRHHFINLNDLYKDIAKSILHDKNFYPLLTENFNSIKERIKHDSLLYTTQSVEDFQEKWLDEFSKINTTSIEKISFIKSLLIVAKSKTAWESIKSESAEHKTYRNQLSHKIALEFYAKEERNSPHHLPHFFNALAAIA